MAKTMTPDLRQIISPADSVYLRPEVIRVQFVNLPFAVFLRNSEKSGLQFRNHDRDGAITLSGLCGAFGHQLVLLTDDGSLDYSDRFGIKIDV